MRFSAFCVAEVPDPDRLMVVGEFEALLVTVTVPESAPAVAGSKCTLNEVVCPCANGSGKDTPLTVKFADALTAEIVTVEFPVLVRVTACDALLFPVAVDGKLREVGEAESVRTDAIPDPDSTTPVEEVGVLLVNVKVAENALAEVGVKPTVNGHEVPGASVSGSDRPE